MNISSRAFRFLSRRIVERRPPDFVIGENNPQGAYLRRWWVIPRNRLFNVYLHEFLRDDDDRALHDHPWFWCSWILKGAYLEIAHAGMKMRTEGSVKFSSPWRAHRVELCTPLNNPSVWTLFITGPRLRSWGFHCPKGWVHWKDFTSPDSSAEIGKGCDQ
jgi:hypothetical protein